MSPDYFFPKAIHVYWRWIPLTANATEYLCMALYFHKYSYDSMCMILSMGDEEWAQLHTLLSMCELSNRYMGV